MEHGIPIGMMGWGCGNDAIRPASAWGLHIAATTSKQPPRSNHLAIRCINPWLFTRHVYVCTEFACRRYIHEKQR